MTPSNYQLGKILHDKRLEKKMSLREFSEYLSISHAYLSKLEKGVDPRNGRPITPTIETLSKIAEGLEIPMGEFLESCGYFQDGEMPPNQIDSAELEKLVKNFADLISERKQLTLNGEEILADRQMRIGHAIDLLKGMVS